MVLSSLFSIQGVRSYFWSVTEYLVRPPGDVPDLSPGGHGGEQEPLPPVDLQEAPAVITGALVTGEAGAGHQAEKEERQSEGSEEGREGFSLRSQVCDNLQGLVTNGNQSLCISRGIIGQPRKKGIF